MQQQNAKRGTNIRHQVYTEAENRWGAVYARELWIDSKAGGPPHPVMCFPAAPPLFRPRPRSGQRIRNCAHAAPRVIEFPYFFQSPGAFIFLFGGARAYISRLFLRSSLQCFGVFFFVSSRRRWWNRKGGSFGWIRMDFVEGIYFFLVGLWGEVFCMRCLEKCLLEYCGWRRWNFYRLLVCEWMITDSANEV